MWYGDFKMKIAKEIKLALVFAVFVLFLNSVFAQNAECPPNSVDLYYPEGKVYIGKTAKQKILSNDKLDVYQHTGILMGKLWDFFFSGDGPVSNLQNVDENWLFLADSIYQVFVINLKTTPEFTPEVLDITLKYNDNLKVNGKSWGEALDELEEAESDRLVEDAKALNSYIKKMTRMVEPKVGEGGGPYFVFLNQNKKPIIFREERYNKIWKIEASSIFGSGGQLSDIPHSDVYDKPSPKELSRFLDQNGACAYIYPYMFAIRRQDHAYWYIDLGPGLWAYKGMFFRIPCYEDIDRFKKCCNCHPGVGVLYFYSKIKEKNEPLFSGDVLLYVNYKEAGSFKLSPTCLLPDQSVLKEISNIAQNGDDVIVKLGDGVNIEDLFPKGVTTRGEKTGLEERDQGWPIIKKGTDGTLEILQVELDKEKPHPNPQIRNAVKAYAIFAGLMRQLNIGDVCVEQDGNTYTIKKKKQGGECSSSFRDQTRQIPKTENIHVLFFVNKQGAGPVAGGGEQPQQPPAYRYGDISGKCTKDNTAKREIHPKGGKKFKIGDEITVKFTAFAENVGDVSIQCNQNCYYECDICKDDKKGYVPNLKPNEKGNLIESCDKQKTKNFEVVFRANDTQIKNLQQRFGASGIKKLASNEVPLEVAILTRKDCQENGKYYVEPDVLCVLFVTNKTEISLLPPPTPQEPGPAKPGKRVKKAIVKIGGVTEVCHSPCPPHKLPQKK